MSELKPCDHCSGEYDPQMGATVHHHNCPNLHFSSSSVAPADLVERVRRAIRNCMPSSAMLRDDRILNALAAAAITAMQPVVDQGREEERARIVAWLREQDGHGEWYEVADMIERGEHHA